MTEERDGFEKWLRDTGLYYSRFDDGYAQREIQPAWQAWQAGARWSRSWGSPDTLGAEI